MAEAFGKFPSLSAFLESYKAARKKRELKEALTGPVDLAIKKIRKKQKQPRDIVEVEATLALREADDNNPGGGKHVRLRVAVIKILVNDPDVSKDVKNARTTGRDVFVAIRIGDAMGIQEKIRGLTAGSDLHLRGEWITREKAHAHGGEKMSVLHFTHHPLGFFCTEVKCYA